MTQKIIDVFTSEINSKPPKKNYATNKFDVHHTDGIWSLDKTDWNDYGPENIRGHKNALVVIDKFSKFDCLIGQFFRNWKCSNNKRLSWAHSYNFEKKIETNWNRPWKRVFGRNFYWFVKKAKD